MVETAKKGQLFPPANLAQWISAIASMATVSLAIWAIFFSSASQSLVQFLQSELSYRNSKIANLEAQEFALQEAILKREQTVRELQIKADDIKAELQGLLSDRQALLASKKTLENEKGRLESKSQALAGHLIDARLKVVQFKLLGELKSKVVTTRADSLYRGSKSRKKNQSEKIEIWSDYVEFIRRSVNELSGDERAIGRDIFNGFQAKCGKLRSRVVIVSDLVEPDLPTEFSNYSSLTTSEREKLDREYDVLKKKYFSNLNKFAGMIHDEQLKIENCFQELE